MIPTRYDGAWDTMMNDGSKESQLLLGLLAILMLVTSVVLFAQQIPPTSSGISKGQIEGARPQDRFIPSYITHSPIAITSNADFVSQGFSGNGTAEDPYVIEGYKITTTGTCISIQDTDAYFVIRDCLLTGGSSGKGVRLDGVDHGEIRNNNISGIDDCGVYLRYSTGNTVVNNTMSGNNNSVFFVFSSSNNTVVNNTISGTDRLGVFIGYSSNNNTVVNNTISGNDRGVTIASSLNNTVMSNTISGNDYGVYLCYGSSNNVVMSNTISGSNYFGVYLYESWDNTLSSNIMVNNGIYISGNEVEYWRHNITTDNLVNGKQLGYFWNCTGRIIDGSQYGQVILANCTGLTVEDGVFSNASVGFLLGYSSYCNLTNNTLSGNYFGVSHYTSSNNIVMNNTVSGNHYGVYLHSSSNNTVVNNTVLENQDYGVYLWTSTEGNLIYLNVIAYNAYENAYDDNPGNHWNSTGMGNYWSDYSGTGVYHVPGSAGSIDYYPFMYPPDTTPPTIDHPADMDYEEATTGNFILWNPSDTHPAYYTISRNGTEVASAIWDWIFVIMDIDGLSVGVYNYTIVVYDTSGNCASDTVFIIVLPQTTTNTTTTTTPNDPGTFDYTTIMIIVSVGAVLIIIIIIFVKKPGGQRNPSSSKPT